MVDFKSFFFTNNFFLKKHKKLNEKSLVYNYNLLFGKFNRWIDLSPDCCRRDEICGKSFLGIDKFTFYLCFRETKHQMGFSPKKPVVAITS